MNIKNIAKIKEKLFKDCFERQSLIYKDFQIFIPYFRIDSWLKERGFYLTQPELKKLSNEYVTYRKNKTKNLQVSS